MSPDQAKAFLKTLGAGQTHSNGEWVSCGCVLAFWTHKNGRDSNPSFGLSAKTGTRSVYNCFACGHGSALELLQAVEFYGKSQGYPHGRLYNLAEGRKVLESEVLELPTAPEYGEFQPPPEKSFKPWPELWLQQFPKVAYPDECDYLILRNVPMEQWDTFDLRWDPERRMIVFPIRNAWGRLAGARGRSVDPGVEGHKRHHDYSAQGVNNTKLVWFNEMALQLDGPMVIVEGQFDCLRVSQVYPKVMACLMALPTHEKLLKLASQNRVVVIPDNDETGEKSMKAYDDFSQKHNTQVVFAKLPKSVKDAGDCHPEWLKDFLNPWLST